MNSNHTCEVDSHKLPIDNDTSMAAFIHETTAAGEALHVIGEVDLANVEEFESALKALASQPLVVVDLEACTYMDSSGLRALTVAYKDVGNKLRVVVPKGGSVRRIFEITGLAEQFNVCETLAEAFPETNGQPPR